MAIEDRSAAFLRYVAERRCVRGPRGDVVRLARWHAPMIGRQHAEALPPLRNRADVRRWARPVAQALGTGHAGDFVSAADRLWREFCSTLGDVAARAALSILDLDADQRRATEAERVVMAWAATVGCRDVTAAQLREMTPVREAIGSASQIGRDPDDVSPCVVSRYVREIAAAGRDINGFCVQDAEPDRHSKVHRWKLEPVVAVEGRAAPEL